MRSNNAVDQAVDKAFTTAPYALRARELLDVGAHQSAAAGRDGKRVGVGCRVDMAGLLPPAQAVVERLDL